MNYRHAYHAGNFADVIKHIVLVLCLRYLQKKEGGVCFIDAHGGAGFYRLDSGEAEKTGEWQRGIGRLIHASRAPPDLKLYLDIVRSEMAAGCYPGSPYVLARCLRCQDRL